MENWENIEIGERNKIFLLAKMAEGSHEEEKIIQFLKKHNHLWIYELILKKKYNLWSDKFILNHLKKYL